MSKSVVTFKPEFLDVVRSLGIVNRSIEIKNIGDEVCLQFKNPEKSVAVIMSAPKEYFSFEGDAIHFDDFAEFYDIYKSFTAPTIVQEQSILTITSPNQKMKYRLTDSEMINSTLKATTVDVLNSKIKDSESNYTITSDEFKKLIKMISLVDGELVTFSVSNAEVNVTVNGLKSSHVYEETFGTDSKEAFEAFKLPLEAKILKSLPSDNYNISFCSSGFVTFNLIRKDDIVVKMIISESTNA